MTRAATHDTAKLQRSAGRPVSRPHDPAEREADRAADTVARGGNVTGWSFASVPVSASSGVHRQHVIKQRTKEEIEKAAVDTTVKAVKETKEFKAIETKLRADPGVKWVENAATTPLGILSAVGLGAVGVGAYADAGKELPFEPPAIPIAPGIEATLVYKGPANAPTEYGVSLTFSEQASVPRGPQKSAVEIGRDQVIASLAEFRRGQTVKAGSKEAKKRRQPDLSKVYVPMARIPPKKDDAPPVRRKAASTGGAGPAHARVDEALSGSGRPLDPAVRRPMESRFGHDFSSVRVHDDARAANAASALEATAFTVGDHIAFATGRFVPSGSAGRHLLAHELAHVVQQRVGGRAVVARKDAVRETLAEEALTLTMALDSAPPEGRQAIVDKCVKLAARSTTALSAATVPADQEGPRLALQRLVKGLQRAGQLTVAAEVAKGSGDREVREAFVDSLRDTNSTVAGQQRLLRAVAPLVGETIPAPTARETPKQWLDAQTPAIGKVFAKLDQMGLRAPELDAEGKRTGNHRARGRQLSEELVAAFFTDAGHDVKPERTGQLSKAATDATGQILADCDVYATYGARLLRAQGWTTAGYLVILTDETDSNGTTRDAHAVALARKENADGPGFSYLGWGNRTVRDLSIWSTDTNALLFLHRFALEVYSPPLKRYHAYYLPALPGGEYDSRLLDPVKANLPAVFTRP